MPDTDLLESLYGGGISCGGGSPTISNNTISGNTADYSDGGGIRCEEDSYPTIIDCIIWGNGDDLDGCEATYCCLEEPIEGEGNISAHPLLVDGPLGGYYLDPGSPCVDAGSYYLDYGSHSTTQADGTPDDGMVDMGYHYPLP